jgi:hypothetical protein
MLPAAFVSLGLHLWLSVLSAGCFGFRFWGDPTFVLIPLLLSGTVCVFVQCGWSAPASSLDATLVGDSSCSLSVRRLCLGLRLHLGSGAVSLVCLRLFSVFTLIERCWRIRSLVKRLLKTLLLGEDSG